MTPIPRPEPITGLTRDEAERRLVRDGRNELPPQRGSSMLVQFGKELVHFFALMLWVAGALAFLADLAALGGAIFAVVLVNATFSFIQERRSDHAAQRLRSLLPRRVIVRRDGEPTEIDAAEIVVGDVMLLASGDRISADARVLVNRGLRVDTSMLTGESESIGIDESGLINAGTFVVDGEADAEVHATGARTRLAQISTLTSGTKRPQRPLTTELNRVVRTISIIAVSVGLTFLLVSLLLGTSGSNAIVFSIGVTVALVPEGLLPTVTLSLAIGAQRMAHRNALVRHLDAVETLGSTTFICTDKTGTLTENRMVATDVWTPTSHMHIDGPGYGPTATLTMVVGQDQSPIVELITLAARCGTGRAVEREQTWVSLGDPMEAAVDACARRLGVAIDEHRRSRPEIGRFPFDATRKRMSSVLHASTYADVVVKGAVEAVLPLCNDDSALIESCRAQATIMSDEGLRVIAIAHRRIDADDGDAELPIDAAGAERELTLVGLIGLLDPPRVAARDALERCRRAGIKVAMITGDHPNTALAIARQVGLAIDGAPVLIGEDLPEDIAALGTLIDHDGVIISRATPEVKLRIANALRQRGHVVAMTGDGVNDGPALRAANIGVAMGRSGTDVAREAADIVLLDDDFATIVEAIAQGRATFLNVRRFLTYHLTDNVAELTPYLIWALSGGRIPLALTVMQILALDIGTDTMSATALGAEPPSAHALDGPPVAGRLMNRNVVVRAFAILGPTEATIAMSAFFVAFLAGGWRPGDDFPEGAALYGACGAAFLAVVLGQTANAWSCRSATETPWQLGWSGNRLLIYTASGEMAFALACLLVGPVADVIEHRFPPLLATVVACASIPAVWAVDAAWKRARRSDRVDPPRPDRTGAAGSITQAERAGRRRAARTAPPP